MLNSEKSQIQFDIINNPLFAVGVVIPFVCNFVGGFFNNFDPFQYLIPAVFVEVFNLIPVFVSMFVFLKYIHVSFLVRIIPVIVTYVYLSIMHFYADLYNDGLAPLAVFFIPIYATFYCLISAIPAFYMSIKSKKTAERVFDFLKKLAICFVISFIFIMLIFIEGLTEPLPQFYIKWDDMSDSLLRALALSVFIALPIAIIWILCPCPKDL